MNYKLRRRHQLVWLIWALVIPVVLITAYSVLPEQEIPTDPQELYAVSPISPTELLDSKQEGPILWKLWKKSHTMFQVEAILQEPLRAPAAFVYAQPSPSSPPSSAVVLGKLGPQGSYRFFIDSTVFSSEGVTLIVHDPIHADTLHLSQLVP